ncbi:MAG: rRNA pseudouridine synthase [Lachnospiraceae bacterium]|nr:rRNA pseudouridine synthase [Lachnospiraceae bacterium]
MAEKGKEYVMEPIRLNKYLAACGICSRRDADKLIEQGAVMVGGRPAVQGMKVTDEDEIFVHGKRIVGPNKKVVLAYYKPMGVVCTERDAHAEKIVVEEIRYPVRVTYAGRLDKDSEGLLLMTNDGDLIDAMMRGANHHEKEYIVKTERAWTEEALVHMRQGVYLEELKVTTRPCEIEQLGPKTIRMVLTQGLNRQIRRMCKTQGYEVSALRRTRVMNVELGSLHSGEYRELTKDEMRSLYEECGLLEMRQHTFRT